MSEETLHERSSNANQGKHGSEACGSYILVNHFRSTSLAVKSLNRDTHFLAPRWLDKMFEDVSWILMQKWPPFVL
jgi:hypothetical protein